MLSGVELKGFLDRAMQKLTMDLVGDTASGVRGYNMFSYKEGGLECVLECLVHEVGVVGSVLFYCNGVKKFRRDFCRSEEMFMPDLLNYIWKSRS